MGSRRSIFTFHGLGPMPGGLDAGEADVWIDTEAFRQVLDRAAGRPGVRITFDDGNASDYDIALPELTRRGITADFFIVTDRIGKAGYLSGEQIAELHAAGMGIGSHGVAHRPWYGLGAADLRDELLRSRELIGGIIGAPVDRAACPMGAYGRAVVSSARAAGYKGIYTSDRGPASDAAFVQARSTLHRQDPLAEFARELELAGAPRQPVGRAVRQLVKRYR